MRKAPFLPARRGMVGACGFALFVSLAPGVSQAGVTGSRHDFSASGPSTRNLGPAGPCSACHRPHKVRIGPELKLWVRDIVTETTYFNQVANPNYVAEATLLCYDCHDNNLAAQNPTPADDDPPIAGWLSTARAQDIAFDSAVPTPKVGYYETTDGSKPTAANLPVAGDPTGGHYWKSEPAGGGLPWYQKGDKLACTICHDPHNQFTGSNQAFFRTSTWNGSATIPLTTYGTSKLASRYDPVVTNPTYNINGSRHGTGTGREMCAECHAYANAGTPKTLWNVAILRPPNTRPQHLSTDTTACTKCHRHNKVFIACYSCHGNETAKNFWPDSIATGNGTVYPNRAGEHLRHINGIAARRVAGPPSVSDKNATCATCHPNPGGDGHETNTFASTGSTADLHRDPWNMSTHFLNIKGATNTSLTSSYNNATTAGGKTCSNVDCHYRTLTPSAGTPPNVGWYNPVVAGCTDCHGGQNLMGGWVGTMLPNAHRRHVGNNPLAREKSYECTQCHPTATPPSGSHQSGEVDWDFSQTLDPGGVRAETYRGLTTGTVAVKYPPGSGSFGSCMNFYCHISSNPPTSTATPLWSATIGTSQCLLCHLKWQTTPPNPSSGLHFGASTTPPLTSRRWHDDTIGAGGCPVCHTTVSAQATHVNGAFDGDNASRMGLFADYKQTSDGIGSCWASPGVVGGAGCHNGQGELGSWQRRWNSAIHYNTTSADATCAGCHGGLGTLPANDWTFGTGVHNSTDGSMEHGRDWDGNSFSKVIEEHSGVGTAPNTQIARCTYCHVYPVLGYTTNAGGRIGWLGNTANNSIYHGNKSIEMNLTQGYTTVAGQYGCTSACHAPIRMESSGWRVNLIAGPEGSCTGCHDGSKSADGAPNVMTYWTGSRAGQDGGHGDAGGLPANYCTDCHDISQPSPSTHNTTPKVYNSLWNNTTRNSNTSHLKTDFFTKFPAPGAPPPAGSYGIQVAFDNYCVKQCHDPLDDCSGPVPSHRHPQQKCFQFTGTLNEMVVEYPVNALRFLPNPDNFVGIPIDVDLNTGAAGGLDHIPCISCHDPHGTSPAPVGAAPSNKMLRWPKTVDDVCGSKCHF